MVDSQYNIIDQSYTNKCPECLTFVFSGEFICPTCTVEFDKVFLPTEAATYNLEQWTKDSTLFEEDEEEIDFPQLYEWFVNDVVSDVYGNGEIPNYNDMLCCNKDSSECKCPESYTFGDGYLFYEDQFLTLTGTKTEDDAYLQDFEAEAALCKSCISYATFTCKPFRSWLRLFYENPNLAEESSVDHQLIDPCSEYEAVPGTPVEEENYILNYINRNMFSEKNFVSERDLMRRNVIDVTDLNYWGDYD